MTAPNIHTKHVAQSISNMVQEWYCGKSDVPHMTVDLFEKRIARFQDDRDSALIAAAFDVAGEVAAVFVHERLYKAKFPACSYHHADIKAAVKALTPPDAQSALQAMIDAAVKEAVVKCNAQKHVAELIEFLQSDPDNIYHLPADDLELLRAKIGGAS